MALGWLTLLRKVPWNQVINNAPLLVDSAKKLWKSVNNKPTDSAQTSSAGHALIAGSDQLTALETSVSQLKNQLLDSSALIKALADQNVALVKTLENQRKLILGLCVMVALVSLAVISILLKLY